MRSLRPSPRSLLGLALLGLAHGSLVLVFAQPSTRAQPPAAEAVRARVRIVVLGSFRGEWIAPIARELEARLRVEATVDPTPIPLPAAAYYAPRRRYRAELLTDFLVDRFGAEPASTRVLGLTSRDISTTAHGYHDWGILGLADDVPGRCAVVSSFRMRRRARTPRHALWRMTTTAVHEIGHVLGLEHCTESSCLMRDAEGTMDTVDEGDGELGPECLGELNRDAPATLSRRPRP